MLYNVIIMGKRKIECICHSCGNQCFRYATEIKKSITKRFFCSKTCAATFNNKVAVKRKPKEKHCVDCNVLFCGRKSKIRCTECLKIYKTSIKYKEMTIEDCINKLSVKGKHASWKHTYVRIFNRTWNKDLRNLPCQNCNYSHHVELAHIKAVSSFEPATKLSVVNSPDNIFVLCPNCHWEFDNGLLDSSNIPPRK